MTTTVTVTSSPIPTLHQIAEPCLDNSLPSEEKVSSFVREQLLSSDNPAPLPSTLALSAKAAIEAPKSQNIVNCLTKELSLHKDKRSPLTYCLKPELGSSGTTFLCQVPDTLSGTSGPYEKFVLKWVKKDLAEVEKYCSDTMIKLGFTAPKIEFIEPSVEKKLKPVLSSTNPSVHCLDDTYTLIYMPEFQGKTLSSAIKNCDTTEFSHSDWQKLLTFCGHLAIIDCFIANADRFARIHPSNFSEAGLIQNTINSGNLMISCDRTQYFVIDNSTICFTKIKAIPDQSTPETEEFSSLFAEEEPTEEPCKVSDSPSELPTTEKVEIPEEKIEDKCNQIFEFFSQHLDKLAKEVIKGLEKEFSDQAKENNAITSPDFPKYVDDIIMGMREGLKTLISNGPMFSLDVKAPYSSCEECLSLMKKNWQSLTKKDTL